MSTRLRRSGLLVATATGLAILFATPPANAKPRRERDLNPIIFVHGDSGSAAQFESQAMRFTSNG